jgi:hypothetical protein
MRFAPSARLVLASFLATQAQAAERAQAAETLLDFQFRPSIIPDATIQPGASAKSVWPVLHRAAEGGFAWSNSRQRPKAMEDLIAASAPNGTASVKTEGDLVEERIVMAFQAAAEAERRR